MREFYGRVTTALLASSIICSGAQAQRSGLPVVGLNTGQVQSIKSNGTLRSRKAQPTGGSATAAVADIAASQFYLQPYITDRTCATDQSSNINAGLSVAAAIAPGAKVVWPGGCLLTSATITNNGFYFDGAGYSYMGGTEIRYTAASGTAFKLMSDGARVHGFRFTTTASNSTATAVQLADGVTNPQSQMVESFAVKGFKTQVDIQSGQFWHVSHFDLHNPLTYGIRIRNDYNVDSGDGDIDAGTLYNDTGVNPGCNTLIRYESGGGLKIRATKTLQCQNSLVLAVPDGATTEDFSVDQSNSFENATIQAIGIGCGGPAKTGLFSNVNLKAQVIASGAGGTVISGCVSNVIVGGVYNGTAYGPIISGGNNIMISSDLVVNGANGAGVTVSDPATNVTVPAFRCNSCATIVYDTRTATNAGGGAGPITRYDVRPLNLPQSSAYATLYRVDIAAFRGARISVQIEGVLQRKGGVNTLIDMLATNSGSTVNMTPAVPTVQAGAQTVDVQFDTTTAAGSVIIGVRPTPATGGGNFQGAITIHVDGQSTKFSVL